MIAILLFLVCLFALNDARFNCAKPSDFKINNPKLHTPAYRNYIRFNDSLLHRYLYDKGTVLRKGTFGEVRAAAGIEPKLVIKKISSNDKIVLEKTKKEIQMLKLMCGKKSEETYKILVECLFKAIAGFKGCVEEKSDIYIFQEYMTMDLRDMRAKKLYRALEGGEKAQVMVNLITKYQKVHDKGIVHNNIKPDNIMMKTNDSSDPRIVDFGLSGKVGSNSLSYSPMYLAPERHSTPILTYGGDVYSLAISFVMMEESAEEVLKKMKSNCFKSYPNDECKKSLQLAVEKAFSKETKTAFLFEVFRIATNYDPTVRCTSMKDFADAITGKAKNIPEFGKSLVGKPKKFTTQPFQIVSYVRRDILII